MKDYATPKLKELNTLIDGSIIRVSAKGVPHLVVDSYYSIAYFSSTKTFNIYEAYATSENRKVRGKITFEEVVNFFKEV